MALFLIISLLISSINSVTPPAQRVQFILGEEGRLEPGHETHPVFSEMEELFVGEDGNMEWKETARLKVLSSIVPDVEKIVFFDI